MFVSSSCLLVTLTADAVFKFAQLRILRHVESAPRIRTPVHVDAIMFSRCSAELEIRPAPALDFVRRHPV
eukprot:42447-Pyramimonas_sp.AAC.1